MSVGFNIGDFITIGAQLNPDKEAIFDVEADQRFTYSHLNRRANRACAAFQSLGLEKGDRVAILAYNGHEYIESFFGPAKAGMIIMPLNWRLTAAELSSILIDGGASMLIFDDEFVSVVEEIRSLGTSGSAVEHWVHIGGKPFEGGLAYEEILSSASDIEPTEKANADDNLFIMYTSGTTGLPKGVVHTHHTQMWAVLTMTNVADMRLNDRYLLPMPLFHVGALTPTIASIYRGNSVIIQRHFEPIQTLALIEQERITSSLKVPAMLTAMLQVTDMERYDCSSLRWIMTGGAPVPPTLIRAYQDMGLELVQAYGLTESCGPGSVIGAADARRKVGSCGKAFYHTGIKILDENGLELPPGEDGEVAIFGEHIMKEYWNQPDSTTKALRNGWLHTGDVASMDEEGFITIQERMKDMIISGGENIYPAEIEHILWQHPDIADAAVIGQPDQKWGESPLAIIVTTSTELGESDVLAHCDGKMARFKLPKNVIFIDEIPRNASGKILKHILRERFLDPAIE